MYQSLIRAAEAKKTMLLFFVFCVWTFLLAPAQDRTTPIHYWYNTLASIVYFYGASIAFSALKQLPLTTSLGKTLLGLGAGIASYGVANIIWGYYNLALKVEVPYPSFADVFFVLYYPCLIYGFISLMSLVRSSIQPKHIVETIIMAVISGIVIFGYITKPDFSAGVLDLTTIFNIFYPLGDMLLLAIAYLGLRVSGGKIQPILLLLIFGTILEVCADLTFAVTTASETYYNGSLVDLMYTASAACMILAIVVIRKNFSATA